MLRVHHTEGRRRSLLGALLISCALLLLLAAPRAVRADEVPVSCTAWNSLITPPKTIRVLQIGRAHV